MDANPRAYMYINPRTTCNRRKCANCFYEKHQSILNSYTGDTYAYKKNMSMQHTGDGPPGDDDYYDPVGEDIRPSGSGFNPNAAAWDPEKMELTRGRIHKIKFCPKPTSK